MSGDVTIPPGWPRQVQPPDSPGWERSAVAWLTTLLPPGWPADDLPPAALAHAACVLVEAELQAARLVYATAWRELSEELTEEQLQHALSLYADRGRDLVTVARHAALVPDALRGGRWRLHA